MRTKFRNVLVAVLAVMPVPLLQVVVGERMPNPPVYPAPAAGVAPVAPPIEPIPVVADDPLNLPTDWDWE